MDARRAWCSTGSADSVEEKGRNFARQRASASRRSLSEATRRGGESLSRRHFWGRSGTRGTQVVCTCDRAWSAVESVSLGPVGNSSVSRDILFEGCRRIRLRLLATQRRHIIQNSAPAPVVRHLELMFPMLICKNGRVSFSPAGDSSGFCGLCAERFARIPR